MMPISAVMVFICHLVMVTMIFSGDGVYMPQQSETARPRACHSLCTAFTQLHIHYCIHTATLPHCHTGHGHYILLQFATHCRTLQNTPQKLFALQCTQLVTLLLISLGCPHCPHCTLSSYHSLTLHLQQCIDFTCQTTLCTECTFSAMYCNVHSSRVFR